LASCGSLAEISDAQVLERLLKLNHELARKPDVGPRIGSVKDEEE
jgi:hypothetical protein